MMDEHNTYPMQDEDDGVPEQVSNIIQHHTIGLMLLTKEPTTKLINPHIGCGTLVAIHGIHGIITASHVVERFPVTDAYCLGLVLSEKANVFKIDKSCIKIYKISDGLYDENGPDLAFIQLSEPDISTIKAILSFQNLDIDHSNYDPCEIDDYGWVVCGTPGVQTEWSENEAGYKKILSLSNYCLFVDKPIEQVINGYDYLDFEIDTKKNSRVPSLLNGMSGGGVWKVEWKEVYNNFQYSYWGIIFWQTELIDGKRFLRCHGRKSIYKLLKHVLESFIS